MRKSPKFCCFNSLSKKNVNDFVGRILLLPQVQWFFSEKLWDTRQKTSEDPRIHHVWKGDPFPSNTEALIIAQDQTRNLPTHLDRIWKGFRLPPKVRILSITFCGFRFEESPRKCPHFWWYDSIVYFIQRCNSVLFRYLQSTYKRVVVGAYSTGTHMARSSGTRIPKQLRSECPPSIADDPFLKPSTTLCLLQVAAFRDATFCLVTFTTSWHIHQHVLWIVPATCLKQSLKSLQSSMPRLLTAWNRYANHRGWPNRWVQSRPNLWGRRLAVSHVLHGLGRGSQLLPASSHQHHRSWKCARSVETSAWKPWEGYF